RVAGNELYMNLRLQGIFRRFSLATGQRAGVRVSVFLIKNSWSQCAPGMASRLPWVRERSLTNPERVMAEFFPTGEEPGSGTTLPGLVRSRNVFHRVSRNVLSIY